MKKKEYGQWILTDGDTNQWGRQLTEHSWEFKQDEKYDEFLSRTIQFEIDLEAYTLKEIESCINSFGYTFHPFPQMDLGNRNIYEVYGEDAHFVIAECIFEQEVYDNL